ncbi:MULTISPECIES: FCD domain-containing protein [Arthrobacter]|uniref:FCD domain-containing protein n=2 Tax=Arthrobacter TaxID=1663 RepID=A0ABU9KNR9_9MICC|nr:FCD domain-containing protein [Arthrobacter sp. YJM1]MDP5228545.1 FCD domain-containing protein [Arthrobacter sp. YJM1]
MKPIRRRSLVDTVVDSLQAQIISGAWAVGARIPSEADLVTELGVSRPSVREGVRSLVQLGLLEARQGDGTYVIAKDPTEVALRRTLGVADAGEVMRVRRALDALAAREAAENRSPADLVLLEAALLARRSAARRENAEAFTDHDVAFHLGVVAASHNQLLAALYASFDASLHSVVGGSAPGSMATAGGLDDSHEALFVAIRDQDGDAAQAAALEVIEEVRRVMEG